mmetsp:Transcript_56529/g.120057  ORF Transcript_56529/g.120057 Transcript_56529/m.120057 type:complete len:201 (+) Transcript_56529:122-724(+)
MCIITTKRDHSMVSITASPCSNSSPIKEECADLSRPTKRSRPDDAAVPPSSSFLADSTTSRTARRVRFAPAPETCTVQRWTEQESSSAWYTGLDVALFKLQEGTDAALLRCLISNAPCVAQLPQDVSLYRGLERLLSPQITDEIKERRRCVVKRVLAEQAEQRVGGLIANSVDGEARIAEASRRRSEKATIWARSMGSLV